MPGRRIPSAWFFVILQFTEFANQGFAALLMALSYPLRFEPIFRRYLWGGRKLGTLLNKPIGEGDDYAESSEIVD